jgi:hypothetical protein
MLGDVDVVYTLDIVVGIVAQEVNVPQEEQLVLRAHDAFVFFEDPLPTVLPALHPVVAGGLVLPDGLVVQQLVVAAEFRDWADSGPGRLFSNFNLLLYF